VSVCPPDVGEFVTRITDCRSTMPEEFDPYSQWLDIFSHERPIDHYRLLGIPRFTDDLDVIVNAADQRMMLIRTYQTGPRGRFTQPLLNEIATAKLCLSNPSSRIAYDAMLEGLASASEPPLPATPARPPAFPPPPPSRPPPSIPPHPSRHSSPRATSDHAASDHLADVNRDLAEASGNGLAADAWHDTEASGFSAGSIVFGFSIAMIVAIVSYVTWQVIATWDQSPLAGGRTMNADGTKPAGTGEDPSPPPRIEPVTVFQESDGSVNLTPAIAHVRGDTLRMETLETTDTLAGWSSTQDAATWRCKIVKLPPNGVFRVLLTYRASAEADQTCLELSIGGHQEICHLRGLDEYVTDSYFVAVTRTGEQTLELSLSQLEGGTFEVQSVRLVMPSGGRP